MLKTAPSLFKSSLIAAALGVVLISSGGCVYRVPIQQGNFLEAKEIEQVTVGMSRAQVRYVLGTPMVIDPFTTDRWDYVYYLKKGRMRTPQKRHFVVYFENGNVARIDKQEMDQHS